MDESDKQTHTSPFGLLTVAGRDRPGIVAQVTQVLFETGCNILDSSMTRLGGAFTVLLIVSLPKDLTITILQKKFQKLADTKTLTIHLQPLSPEEASTNQKSQPLHECIISVLGADQPGIVFRVTQQLAQMGCNITDLHTRVIGSPEKPVYAMTIEGSHNDAIPPLQQKLTALEKELNIEIRMRNNETLAM